MIEKIKEWIFGKVLFGKVVGKYVKHAAGALTAILFGDKIPLIAETLTAMGLTEVQVEAGIVVLVTGLFGAAWNFVEHRLKK